MSSKYKDVIIGLEVHVQLTALKTKLFCSCNNDYRGKAPNTFTCPICLGLPGSLPVVNKNAIEFATRLALALGSQINDLTYFFSAAKRLYRCLGSSKTFNKSGHS